MNGLSVNFSYILSDGDKVAVYPTFEAFDISPLIRLRSSPLRINQFVCDAQLGKLARYLRLVGFDALFDNYYQDDEIVNISIDQHRIVLTRDKMLLKDNRISHGYWVTNKP